MKLTFLPFCLTASCEHKQQAPYIFSERVQNIHLANNVKYELWKSAFPLYVPLSSQEDFENLEYLLYFTLGKYNVPT